MERQQLLKEAWLTAKEGCMCGREQARAWALREVWIEQNVTKKAPRSKLTHKDLYGMLEFVRQRVVVVGAGKVHPVKSSLSKMFAKMDNDKEWFPGKRDPDARAPGPAPVLRGVKRTAVAEAAMGLKRRGVEPTYADIVAQCPSAALNPDTGLAVHPNRVYKVVNEDCYDNDPALPWRHQPRVAKQRLTDAAMLRRFLWAKSMSPLPHTGEWLYLNIVWTDICNSVLPRTVAKSNEQKLARKGRKGWVSNDSRYEPENMRGDTMSLKLAGRDTERVYWAPVLTQGKLHVEILPHDFPGETEEGARILMQKVRAALNVRFQGAEKVPNVIFVDRGNGFYEQSSGNITPGFKAALKQYGLKNFMKDNCGLQPGQIGDTLLHETAVAWIRRRERKSVPVRAWEESREGLSKRLKQLVSEFNATYDVESLCRKLPKRLELLVEGKGKKLKT